MLWHYIRRHSTDWWPSCVLKYVIVLTPPLCHLSDPDDHRTTQGCVCLCVCVFVCVCDTVCVISRIVESWKPTEGPVVMRHTQDPWEKDVYAHVRHICHIMTSHRPFLCLVPSLYYVCEGLNIECTSVYSIHDPVYIRRFFKWKMTTPI